MKLHSTGILPEHATIRNVLDIQITLVFVLVALILFAIAKVYTPKGFSTFNRVFFFPKHLIKIVQEELGIMGVTPLFYFGIFLLIYPITIAWSLNSPPIPVYSLTNNLLKDTLIISGIVSGYVVFKIAINYFIDKVTQHGDLLKLVRYQEFLTYGIIGIWILPIMAFGIYYLDQSQFVLNVALYLPLLVHLLRIMMVFSIGFKENFSKVYIILYFCVLEMCPLLITSKVLGLV